MSIEMQMINKTIGYLESALEFGGEHHIEKSEKDEFVIAISELHDKDDDIVSFVLPIRISLSNNNKWVRFMLYDNEDSINIYCDNLNELSYNNIIKKSRDDILKTFLVLLTRKRYIVSAKDMNLEYREDYKEIII